jgi:aminoglycoside 6'-N-acetyltransferase I
MIETHRLSSDNLGLLDDIAADVFDGDIDPGRLSAYLAAPGHLMIVATVDQQVVGQVAACVHHHPDQPPDLYIDNLGVAPVFQRRGIARRLVDEVLDWGESSGCRQAWIVTETDNVAARALYVSRGASAQPVVMFSYELGQPRAT